METYADWAIKQAQKDHGVYDEKPTHEEDPDREYESWAEK